MDEKILEITKKFHDTYEKLSKEYGYETREDTKVFDINSNNGKLMYATVNEIVSPILKENQELKKQLENANEKIILLQASEPMLNYKKSIENAQQKEFIKYLEDEIEQKTPNVKWKHYNEDGFNDYDVENPSCIEMRPTNKILKEILQKYKEIIGASND